jgi:hypothetical protein
MSFTELSDDPSGYVSVQVMIEKGLLLRLHELSKSISETVHPEKAFEGRHRDASVASTLNLALAEGLRIIDEEVQKL